MADQFDAKMEYSCKAKLEGVNLRNFCNNRIPIPNYKSINLTLTIYDKYANVSNSTKSLVKLRDNFNRTRKMSSFKSSIRTT